jgi:serine/threonine protein kinase
MGGWMSRTYLKAPHLHTVVSYRVHAYQTFQLLTGKPLFNPKDDPRGRFSADDEHLLHMMQLTGQTFEAGMLKASAKAGEFFESNGEYSITSYIIPSQPISFLLTRIGNLSRITGAFPQNHLIKAVQAYNKMESSSELHSSVTFIKRCLQLNPADRASSAELLADPWLKT